MTIRENMAQNLSLLCREHGNISVICQKMNINRQQFNRYLSGRSLPNATTIQKICNFFNIEENVLFAAPKSEGSKNSDDLIFCTSTDPLFQKMLGNLSKPSHLSIPSGNFLAYMVVSTEPVNVACCVISIIKKNGHFTTFRRTTNFSVPKDSPWRYVRGDHHGVIIERAHWLYFLGFADYGKQEPSLLTVQWLPFLPKTLSGTALVGIESGPVPLPVVIEQAHDDDTRLSLLPRSRVYPLDAVEISTTARKAIAFQIEKMNLFLPK